MMSTAHNEIYKAIVDISQDYLGPAASRFIDRSIYNHLHKLPEEITTKDLKQLIEWVRVSVAVLTEDATLVTEYVTRLEAIEKAAGGK
jgi:hypothetical protein